MSPLAHLLASKRSLSSLTHVYRANDLCTSTRHSLETSAVLTARTSFLRSGITSQLHVLEQVSSKTHNTAKQSRAEFEAAVESLDSADARLRGTLDTLRETIVEAGLRPASEERRNLLDFVDEGAVSGLLGAIKNIIDEAGQGFTEWEDRNKILDERILEVRRMLDNTENQPLRDSTGDAPATEGNIAAKERSPIPDILHDMETHARDMAGELEGLVRHYDMCVTALKHTSGGSSDAALHIATNLPAGMDMKPTPSDIPAEPMSEAQLEEMMAVLEEDAEHVDGAVTDIRSHIADMESLFSHVESHTSMVETEHTSTVSVFALLEEIGRDLPSTVARTRSALHRWTGERSKVSALLDELQGLTHFYHGFLRAYDNLLIEIGRRRDVEMEMEKEIQRARRRLEKLYDDDVAEREAFGKEQGDFLPMDIWPGLTAGPLRFEILEVGEGRVRVPDIDSAVVRQAIRRVHGE